MQRIDKGCSACNTSIFIGLRHLLQKVALKYEHRGYFIVM